MSTNDGFRHRLGKKGEFCVAVGHVTMTAGIYRPTGLIMYVIRTNPRRPKDQREWATGPRMDLSVNAFKKALTLDVV